VYSNITADNCKILFFVRQADGAQSQTGLQHSVQLNNFYALNCGAFEGVMQFSRASNVIVSNGIVVNSSAATALIRGNHANCQFVNIGWYGDTASCVNLDASTYAPDSSQANENNIYDINVWGQVNVFADANIATSFRTLNGCTGTVTFRLAPASAFFGYELRNGTSIFNLSCNTSGGAVSKFVLANTALNFDGSTLPYTFAGFADGYNYSQVSAVSYTNFVTVAAGNVANDSLFLDTSTGKLSYKNSAGVVNALY
jgi:hypothetical protein